MLNSSEDHITFPSVVPICRAFLHWECSSGNEIAPWCCQEVTNTLWIWSVIQTVCLIRQDLLIRGEKNPQTNKNQQQEKSTLFGDIVVDLVDLRSGCQSPFHFKQDTKFES